ncbi:SUMO protease [Saccharomycopsis crataegensis]|uniref:SUMO protease n=1 Tax=Saccharomycopsis crataegensis TaxID=43959 RepID=A0AAV5QQQ9_9ASCO|nr:SUMO protease [Saccharomycopsis crataegensis]
MFSQNRDSIIKHSNSSSSLNARIRKRKYSNLSNNPLSSSTKYNDTITTASDDNNHQQSHQRNGFNIASICSKAWGYLKSTIDPYLQIRGADDEYKKLHPTERAPKRFKKNDTTSKESTNHLMLTNTPKNKIVNENQRTPVLSLENRDYDFTGFEAKSAKLNQEMFFSDNLFSLESDIKSIMKENKKEKQQNKLYGSSFTFKRKFNRKKSRDVIADSQNYTDVSSINQSFNPILPKSMTNISINYESSPNNSMLFDDDLRIIKVRKIPKSSRLSKNSIFQRTDEDVESLMVLSKYKTYYKILNEKRKLQENLYKQRDFVEGKEIIQPLKENELKKVEEIWKLERSQPGVQIVSLANIDISVRDLSTLKDRQWLNDNIMDSYLSMVVERSKKSTDLPNIFVFTTHFYTTLSGKGYSGVKRWAKRKKIDVTKLDYVFVPINVMNSHWSLAVVNNKHKKFQYFDSLPGSGQSILMDLQDYMTEESKRLYPNDEPIDYENVYEFVAKEKFPQQKNGFDCGVFACTGINFLSKEGDLKFSQNDMPIIRRKMAYEIITSHLKD